MKEPISYTVDRERWANMSILDQMGNISSEVGRSINAKRQGRAENLERAIIRALDLFDATTEVLVECRSPRAREVLRAKDQFLQAMYDEQSSTQSLSSIECYFMQYAIAARRSR